MDDQAEVQCPYCREWLSLYVDPDQVGSFVQDCDVCCRPWQVHVDRDEDGELILHVDRS